MGKWRYGVIVDAGSSGTRVHIYRWLESAVASQETDDEDLKRLPLLETHKKWTKKTDPGVSSFAGNPKAIGPDHLKPLLEHALEFVPQHSVQDTPIFILATAGVRLLPKSQKTELLREICAYTRAHSRFLLADCDLHVQVITGETEGLYGWIASNYLLGGFDTPAEHGRGREHPTYGFLELGGASAQIAFAPNSTEAEKHANDLTLLRLRTLDGQDSEYRVFVTSWLGYGVNAARKTYVAALVEASAEDDIRELPDPCLPSGLRTTLDGTLLPDAARLPDTELYLMGTGKFEDCLRATSPLLDKDAPCEDQPCLFHGVHTPAIDFEVNHFIGISEYWHTTHDIFEKGEQDNTYDFTTYQQRVSIFCGQDWASIQAGVAREDWGKKVDEQAAYEVCFKASWLTNMLHSGIGIPREGLKKSANGGNNDTEAVLKQDKQDGFLEPFQAVNKIKHTKVSWTLGKMVLYASSQVPSSGESNLPVGFGSNEAVIPTDFQRPGETADSNATVVEIGDESLAKQTHHSLYDAESPRRVPGFLLFALIFAIIGVYLCSRNRQARQYCSMFGGNGRKRRPFSVKLPFSSRIHAPSYERVLEDGVTSEDPRAFELGDAESEDSDQRDPGTPGWGTARKKAQAGPVDQDLMDRSGLVVRTESRERLALNTGRKSRTGSPTRQQGARSWSTLIEQ